MTDQELADAIKAQYQSALAIIAQPGGGGEAEVDVLIGYLQAAYAKAAKITDSWGPVASAHLAVAVGKAMQGRTYPGNDNRFGGLIWQSMGEALHAGNAIPNTTIQSGAC